MLLIYSCLVAVPNRGSLCPYISMIMFQYFNTIKLKLWLPQCSLSPHMFSDLATSKTSKVAPVSLRPCLPGLWCVKVKWLDHEVTLWPIWPRRGNAWRLTFNAHLPPSLPPTVCLQIIYNSDVVQRSLFFFAHRSNSTVQVCLVLNSYSGIKKCCDLWNPAFTKLKTSLQSAIS